MAIHVKVMKVLVSVLSLVSSVDKFSKSKAFLEIKQTVRSGHFD